MAPIICQSCSTSDHNNIPLDTVHGCPSLPPTSPAPSTLGRHRTHRPTSKHLAPARITTANPLPAGPVSHLIQRRYYPRQDVCAHLRGLVPPCKLDPGRARLPGHCSHSGHLAPSAPSPTIRRHALVTLWSSSSRFPIGSRHTNRGLHTASCTSPSPRHWRCGRSRQRRKGSSQREMSCRAPCPTPLSTTFTYPLFCIHLVKLWPPAAAIHDYHPHLCPPAFLPCSSTTISRTYPTISFPQCCYSTPNSAHGPTYPL